MAEIDIDGGVGATTLSGALTAGATSFTVADGSGYPPGGGTNFYVVIDRGQSGEEVVEISSRSGNTFTVAGGASGRGADGTSDTSHDSGATVEHCVPALALQEANTHANQTTGTPHGSAYVTPGGNVATATALETARNIGGVSFDGTADINLPGVNTAGSQDTSGNAATATLATTATTANALSASETAWTPNIRVNGSTVSSTVANAVYFSLGDLRVCWFKVTMSGSGTGTVTIDGHPNASSSPVGDAIGGHVDIEGTQYQAFIGAVGRLTVGTSSISLSATDVVSGTLIYSA